MKAKILITYAENMRHFGGTLPTKRFGFCEIVRSVTIQPCEFYDDGCYGYVTIGGKKFNVASGDGKNFQISA